MSGRFHVYIPARFASTRLPGKPLLDIGGKPLLRHVVDAASASGAETVTVATDSEQVASAARSFADVVMTSAAHQSGTDRICEAASGAGRDDGDIIVNVQGDEYGLPPELIDQAARALHDNPDKPMATLCEPLQSLDDLLNPNVVKLEFDEWHNAVWFSRTPVLRDGIPAEPGTSPGWRHIGLYAYRMRSLREFTQLPPCAEEREERLEQLRALYQGWRIHVVVAAAPCGIGVDTAEDLEKARRQSQVTSHKSQVTSYKAKS